MLKLNILAKNLTLSPPAPLYLQQYSGGWSVGSFGKWLHKICAIENILTHNVTSD